MKYWYYAFKHDSRECVSIAAMRGSEFNVVRAIDFNFGIGLSGILITFWHEISKEQFKQIADSLNINPLIELEENVSTGRKDFDNDFIERMYSLYPSKCPVKNRSLGKCSKDKEKIRRLLREYSEEEIEFVIRNEVETKMGKEWMQNFSTFLNNFPDPDTIMPKEVKEEETTNNNLVIGGTEYR